MCSDGSCEKEYGWSWEIVFPAKDSCRRKGIPTNIVLEMDVRQLSVRRSKSRGVLAKADGPMSRMEFPWSFSCINVSMPLKFKLNVTETVASTNKTHLKAFGGISAIWL